MSAQPAQRGISVEETRLDALAQLALALASADTLPDALLAVAEGAARATRADVVVARVADEVRRSLNAVAVATDSVAVAAELEGSRIPLDGLPADEEVASHRLPSGVRRAAERVGASHVLFFPTYLGDDTPRASRRAGGGSAFCSRLVGKSSSIQSPVFFAVRTPLRV